MSEFMQGAHCRSYDPDVFFPAKSDKEGIERAKSICQDCPSTTQCLILAIHTVDRDAVMGGMSPMERDRFLALFHHNQTMAIDVIVSKGGAHVAPQLIASR